MSSLMSKNNHAEKLFNPFHSKALEEEAEELLEILEMKIFNYQKKLLTK